MKKEEKLSDEEKTARLASKAFYKTKKTPKSQMIMIKILQSNRLDNLRRTNKMAALAYFVKPDTKDLDINYDLVEVIFEVSNALIATKQTKNYYQGYPFFHCPIPWGFGVTEKNYKRYIDPWLESLYYYQEFVPSFDKYLIKETWIFCPCCEKPILTIKQTTKANALKTVKERFKDTLEDVKEVLIDKKEIEKRTHEDYSFSYSYSSVYKPPYWVASYIECPKCKKKIRLKFTLFKGSHAEHYDPVEPPEFETKEIIIENKEFYPSFVEAKKFEKTSHWLTPKGYNQLVNSFLGWAEPSVSNLEFEILKLVDVDTLDKYFEHAFSEDKKTDEGEDQE